MRRIYLDHNATTPPTPGVVEAVTDVLAHGWGNPSSGHAEGLRAHELLDRARAQVASAVGAAPSEVVLTSGGSEADALALRGLVDAELVNSLVVWDLEHPAVIDTARWLAQNRGLELRTVPSNRKGQVEPEALTRALLGLDRPLVSIMLAQNETGTLNNLPALARLAREKGALVHTDAVQAFGKVGFGFRKLGVDVLSISSHKIGGPKGAGALIVGGEELFPVPFCMGGGQEAGRRQGTEALPALVGFGVAASKIRDRVAAGPRLAALRDRLEKTVLERVPGTLALGFSVPRLPNTSALAFKNVRGADIVAACDARGLAVSAGSACHAAATTPSAVATGIGLPGSHRFGLVRVSMGPETTDEEVSRATEILCEVALSVKKN